MLGEPAGPFAALVGQLVLIVVHRGGGAIDDPLVVLQLPQQFFQKAERQLDLVGNIAAAGIAAGEQILEHQRFDFAFGQPGGVQRRRFFGKEFVGRDCGPAASRPAGVPAAAEAAAGLAVRRRDGRFGPAIGRAFRGVVFRRLRRPPLSPPFDPARWPRWLDRDQRRPANRSERRDPPTGPADFRPRCRTSGAAARRRGRPRDGTPGPGEQGTEASGIELMVVSSVDARSAPCSPEPSEIVPRFSPVRAIIRSKSNLGLVRERSNTRSARHADHAAVGPREYADRTVRIAQPVARLAAAGG